ncbi:11705_t:CDS:2, partial [Funneliformis geosporum]
MMIRFELMYNSTKLSIRYYVCLTFCLILFGNYLNFVDAKLILYDKENNEFDSLENFDLLFLKNSDKHNIDYYNNDVIISGKIEFAQLLKRDDNQVEYDNNVDLCTLRPVSIGVALLVIPFSNITSDRNFACNKLSDLLLSNKWITQDLILPDNFQNDESEGAKILPNGTYLIPQNDSSLQPTKRTFPLAKKYEHFINRNQIYNKKLMKLRGEPTSVVPEVILFASLNNGDPGIKEPFMVDRNLFKEIKVGVTLLRKDDMLHLESLVSTIDHVSITSDAGPWIRLLHSQNFLAWTINWGVTFGAIFLFTIYAITCFFDSSDFVPENPNMYILPGIAFSSLVSLIILIVDPYNVRERLTLVGFTLITELNYLILGLLYVKLQYSWAKAAGEITLFDTRLSPITRISTRIHCHILYLNILLILATFIFRVLEQANLNIQNIFIPSIIWEIIFITLMNMGFLSFGMFMILALATDREVKQKIGESLVFKFSNKADRRKALKVFVIMMILMFSFSFLTISNVLVSSLSPTVSNFWKSRVTSDTSISLSMITILFLLRSKSCSRYLVNPSSSLLTTRPSSRSLGPTPEQVEDDERRNSAAYTTRTAVVRPEPSYKMNLNRISFEKCGTSLGMGGIIGNTSLSK